MVKPKPNQMSSMFPTAYHRLATELGLGPLTHGLMSAASSADKKKTSPGPGANPNGVPNLGTPGVGGKGSAGTVFQREAYCEICQREFCNKYFLKTHKANIHGIVDPNDSNSKALFMAKVSQPQPPKLNNTSPKHEPLVSSLSSHVSSLPKLTPASNPITSSKPSQPQQPPTNDSMEDFCAICQKHFCNKYYLKKHKVDVHNIRPDGSKPPTSNESILESRGPMPHMSSVGGGAPHMSHLPMMVPPLGGLNPTSMNNMLFMNPFGPNMAAMSMVPPMMQPHFFMPPNMSNLAAAHNASHALSNVSPEMKNELKQPMMNVPKLEKGEAVSDSEKGMEFCNICRSVRWTLVTAVVSPIIYK